MSPSLLRLGTAALACAGGAFADKWQLQDVYNSKNFVDKFDFFSDADPNQSHVVYQSRADAEKKGLFSTSNNEVYLGVDSKTKLADNVGRDSVRVESKVTFNKGLFVGRFNHLPKNTCGVWPAFWTVGPNWPFSGEVDILEGWNNDPLNKPAFHMGNAAKYGKCMLDSVNQTGTVVTNNCDNQYQNPPIQWPNQGCVAADNNGPWGASDGGVFAMEWTSDFIKLYTWKSGKEPANIESQNVDTSTWGFPVVSLKSRNCDVDGIFKDQRIVINIALCGDAVQGNWGGCSASTGQPSCNAYISRNPQTLTNAFFKIKDIRIFKTAPPAPTTTSTTTKASSTSTTKTSSTTSSKTSTTTTTSSSSTKTSSTTSSTTVSSTKASSTTVSSTTASSTTVSSTKASSTTVSSTTSSSTTSSSKTSTSASSSSSAVVSEPGENNQSTSSSVASSTASSSYSAQSSSTKSSSGSASSSATASATESQSSSASATDATSSQSASSSAGVTSTATISSSAGVTSSGTISSSAEVTSSATVSSSAEVTSAVSSSEEMTTSTVYTTTVHTVTKCPPTVTNCPAGGYVTTETIPLYTTVCPVTGTTKAPPKPTTTAVQTSKPGHPHSEGPTTITTKITKIYTITSCAPTVTNCPVGHVTTEVTTTTYCPGEQTGVPTTAPGGVFVPGSSSRAPVTFETHTVVPQPTGGSGNSTGIYKPTATGPGTSPCTGPECPPPAGASTSAGGGIAPTGVVPPAQPSGTESCTGPNCKPPVVVSGAAKTGFSVVAVLGAMAAMMM